MEAEDLLQQVTQYSPRYVCVTGGEPLAQKDCLKLLADLCDLGYQVSLETSGSLDISEVDDRVIRVMDLKTPASGEVDKNRYENIDLLSTKDQLKFVLCDEPDYQWAKQMLDEYQLSGRCEILFSAAEGQLKPDMLADWIIRDQLPVRMQVQLHKILWGGGEGR